MSFVKPEITLTASRITPSISDIPKLSLPWLTSMSSFQISEKEVSSLKALGHIIRTRRRASSLRIDDAAALSGVSVDLLSRLENGASGVSTSRVLQVLDALGLAMLVVDKEKVPRLRTVLDRADR
jgi:hypothetical protein